MRDHGIVFAGLMPHAPILVPGVGGDDCEPAEGTIEAMAELARRVIAARPDTVVVVSPHSPRRGRAFGLWMTPRLTGSFLRFGTDANAVDLPRDAEFTERLGEEADRVHLRTWEIVDQMIDHGAAVPLSCLITAGWQSPTVLIGLNGPGDGGLDELGRAIAATAEALERRVAVIASGDMSHRLSASAPLGYDADGLRFDHRFVELLQHGAPKAILRVDRALAENAGEDVVDSTRVALSACDFDTEGRTILSYDGPFGVGYGVAILCDRSGLAGELRLPEEVSALAELPRIARTAIRAKLEGGEEAMPFRATGPLAACQGIFVTVRSETGALRGCQGFPHPATDDLATLTWRLAVRAAFHDPRFAPVTGHELSDLRLTVSLLGEFEKVESASELDPERYGVLVSCGRRAGLLLPGIREIRSVAEQLMIAREKGGIEPDEPVEIQRFRTTAIEEL